MIVAIRHTPNALQAALARGTAATGLEPQGSEASSGAEAGESVFMAGWRLAVTGLREPQYGWTVPWKAQLRESEPTVEAENITWNRRGDLNASPAGLTVEDPGEP